MSLVIAWRNPGLRALAEKKVRRVFEDRFGSIYTVTQPDGTKALFELYPGGGITVTGEALDVRTAG